MTDACVHTSHWLTLTLTVTLTLILTLTLTLTLRVRVMVTLMVTLMVTVMVTVMVRVRVAVTVTVSVGVRVVTVEVRVRPSEHASRPHMPRDWPTCGVRVSIVAWLESARQRPPQGSSEVRVRVKMGECLDQC